MGCYLSDRAFALRERHRFDSCTVHQNKVNGNPTNAHHPLTV